MGETVNNCAVYINGVLILSSVSILYIVNADESHKKIIEDIKDYYDENIASLMKSLMPKIKGDPKLYEYLIELQEQADDIINEPIPLHAQYPGHFITHYQALMILLGLAIGCCSLFYLSLFFSLYSQGFTDFLFYSIAVFWVFIIGLIVRYVYKSHKQRYRFVKFEKICKKKESLVKKYYDVYTVNDGEMFIGKWRLKEGDFSDGLSKIDICRNGKNFIVHDEIGKKYPASLKSGQMKISHQTGKLTTQYVESADSLVLAGFEYMREKENSK